MNYKLERWSKYGKTWKGQPFESLIQAAEYATPFRCPVRIRDTVTNRIVWKNGKFCNRQA
jgi:hypothetical protein